MQKLDGNATAKIESMWLYDSILYDLLLSYRDAVIKLWFYQIFLLCTICYVSLATVEITVKWW